MKDFLTKNRWESTQIFETDVDTYQLKEFIPRKFAGYLTTFTNTMTFTSQYTAPYGNDEEFGRINTDKYKLIGPNKIEIIVEKEMLPIGLNMSTGKPNSKKTVFLISKPENELIFA